MYMQLYKLQQPQNTISQSRSRFNLEIFFLVFVDGKHPLKWTHSNIEETCRFQRNFLNNISHIQLSRYEPNETNINVENKLLSFAIKNTIKNFSVSFSIYCRHSRMFDFTWNIGDLFFISFAATYDAFLIFVQCLCVFSTWAYKQSFTWLSDYVSVCNSRGQKLNATETRNKTERVKTNSVNNGMPMFQIEWSE